MSAPGVSWDAILKMAKIKLALITDLSMYIFFGKGTRGRISYIFNRYRKANKNYLKYYDSKEEAKHILNLLQILACTYSLEKIQEVEFLIFLIGIGKPTRNI